MNIPVRSQANFNSMTDNSKITSLKKIENGKFPHAGGGFELDSEHTCRAKTDYKQLPPRLAEAGGFGSTPHAHPTPTPWLNWSWLKPVHENLVEFYNNI